MSSDRIPEYEKIIVEKVESGLRNQVIDESKIDNYEEIEALFDTEEDAKDYLERYHNFFGEYEGAFDYLEQWEDNNGTITGIIDSLTE